MLQAKLSSGDLITIYKRSLEEIEKMREELEFFCPACNSRVIMKAGTKMVPHFAHRSRAHCPSSERGEGVYHEQGKLLLYQWLVKQGITVNLEEYIPEIEQRPDILIQLNHRRLAIEYQCSRISMQEMLERTRGYQSQGITPIWILGANHFHRLKSNQLKINTFILSFIHQYNPKFPLTLYFFDSISTNLIIANDIYLLRRSQAIAKLTIKKLANLQFTNLFQAIPMNKQKLIQEWKQAKYRFRMYPPKKLFGEELAWYNWLYKNGTHREHLPSIVYLPVSSQFLMRSDPWVWQSRLYFDIIAPLSVGKEIPWKSYQTRFKINPQHYPLVKHPHHPIIQYLQVLSSLGYLEQLPNHTFKKVKEITSYSHIEKAVSGDTILMDALCKNFQANYEHESYLIRYTK